MALFAWRRNSLMHTGADPSFAAGVASGQLPILTIHAVSGGGRESDDRTVCPTVVTAEADVKTLRSPMAAGEAKPFSNSR